MLARKEKSCFLESFISQSREVPVQYPGGSGPVRRVASKAAHGLRSLMRNSDDQQTKRQEKSVWGATHGYISRALGVAPSKKSLVTSYILSYSFSLIPQVVQKQCPDVTHTGVSKATLERSGVHQTKSVSCDAEARRNYRVTYVCTFQNSYTKHIPNTTLT